MYHNWFEIKFKESYVFWPQQTSPMMLDPSGGQFDEEIYEIHEISYCDSPPHPKTIFFFAKNGIFCSVGLAVSSDTMIKNISRTVNSSSSFPPKSRVKQKLAFTILLITVNHMSSRFSNLDYLRLKFWQSTLLDSFCPKFNVSYSILKLTAFIIFEFSTLIWWKDMRD